MQKIVAQPGPLFGAVAEGMEDDRLEPPDRMDGGQQVIANLRRLDDATLELRMPATAQDDDG